MIMTDGMCLIVSIIHDHYGKYVQQIILAHVVRTRLRVTRMLARSSVSWLLFASCLVCWLFGIVWFFFFLFSPQGQHIFASGHTIIRKRYVSAKTILTK